MIALGRGRCAADGANLSRGGSELLEGLEMSHQSIATAGVVLGKRLVQPQLECKMKICRGLVVDVLVSLMKSLLTRQRCPLLQ